MDKLEVGSLLAMNKANFPYAYKDMSKTEMTALLESWSIQFKNYPAELIQGAFMEALKVCRNPITIADIFDRLSKIKKATEKPTETLWQEFLKAASKVSYLAEGFHYNVKSKTNPYITQGQEKREEAQQLFNSLDDKIKVYTGNYKRLIDFGNMDNDRLEQIIFPAFRRSMESQSSNEELLSVANPNTVQLASGQADIKTKMLNAFTDKKPKVMASNTNYEDCFDSH